VKSVTVKGISAVTSAPTANDLTYTGSAQALVTAGSATYGTMVYSLDGETYSAAIPTATNAGDYTVYYKVDGGTDYTGTTAQTVDVTITIPGTIALLKSAINSATNLDYINTNALGKYVTATGTLQSNSEGAVGIIGYISKTAVDNTYDNGNGRILIVGIDNASTSSMWATSNDAVGYTDVTLMNGFHFTTYHNNDSYPAAQAAWNYSKAAPTGASNWFLPSRGQRAAIIGSDGVGNNDQATLTAKTGMGKDNFWLATERSDNSAGAWTLLLQTDSITWESHEKNGHNDYVRAICVY
jgi:hypothetical protein